MAELPSGDEVLRRAKHHLDEARRQLSEVRDWTTAVDSPLTEKQRAAVEALRDGAIAAKDLIDQTKGRYFDAFRDE